MQRPLFHANSGWPLDAQVEVARVYVGTFMTSLDMAGFSLTVLVLDDERVAALDADTQVCSFAHLKCPEADALETLCVYLVPRVSQWILLDFDWLGSCVIGEVVPLRM